MLLAVWDDNNQTLQIANAGSVQPLFVGANADPNKPPSVRTIQAEGFPLGMFPNAEYEEFTLSTRAGDLIVFFSDGIVDAVNGTEEMFGDERLIKLLESQHHPTARSTVDAILQAVTEFQAGTAHFDDETIVVLRVL
jgi:sigma-B regulation protein RsbU (phosphoserine phosphatase)